MKRREPGGDSGDSEEAENILYLIRIFFFSESEERFLSQTIVCFPEKNDGIELQMCGCPVQRVKIKI